MCVLSWHGGVDVKRFVLGLGAIAGLVLAASSVASALEEQRGAAPPQAAAPAPAAGVAATDEKAAPAKAESGPEIRIPGLGKLGTLPKMDFGLELLYGAADSKSAPVRQEPVSPADDGSESLTIHGSMKHNF